jgi:o-succinylbenzoate---CoA ligase
MVVEAWLARAAAARPLHAALQTPEGSWSYAELLAAARSGAAELAERGACAGERVAIALPPGLAFAHALHACMLLGAVAVPLDPRLTAGERARVMEGSSIVLEEPLPAPPLSAPPLSALQFPAPPLAGGRASSPAGGDGPGSSAENGERRLSGHELAATAVVIHTSGTTSSPRPVELTYGNFLWSALGSAVALGVDPDERWLCAMPVSHVGGLSILMRSAIYATTAVVHERFHTERVMSALRGGEVTVVSLVATTLARLLDAGLSHPPRLRCALTGGGAVGAPLLRRARAAGVPVSLTYGLTEACSQVTTTPIAAVEQGRRSSRPLFCARVRIAADGEVMVAGPIVASGSRDGDGWLRTGDLGCFDEAGGLLLTGRKAELIVSGGENVAPAEVESVLEQHPDVLEAAVVPRADGRWGEAVTAFVVARPGHVIDREALRGHCAQALAPYKVPKQILVSDGPLPRTGSGKLLRRRLR